MIVNGSTINASALNGPTNNGLATTQEKENNPNYMSHKNQLNQVKFHSKNVCTQTNQAPTEYEINVKEEDRLKVNFAITFC